MSAKAPPQYGYSYTVEPHPFDAARERLNEQSQQARHTLRGLPHTRDTVLHLLMIEAQVRFVDGKLRNIDSNRVLHPEQALIDVIAKHLKVKP